MRVIYRDDSFRKSRYIKISVISFFRFDVESESNVRKRKNRKIGENNRSIEYWNTSDISRRFISKIALHKNFYDIFLSIWKWIERTKKKKNRNRKIVLQNRSNSSTNLSKIRHLKILFLTFLWRFPFSFHHFQKVSVKDTLFWY